MMILAAIALSVAINIAIQGLLHLLGIPPLWSLLISGPIGMWLGFQAGKRTDSYRWLATMRDTRLVRALARIKPPVPYVIRRNAALWYGLAGYASCDHCKLSWAQVEPHTVTVSHPIPRIQVGEGWFALCEKCWKKLPAIDRARYMHARFQDRLDADILKRLVSESLK